MTTSISSADSTAWRAPDDDDLHDTLLEFNAHVLALARHERTPLIERARFLAILGRNLDEFFAVHVGEAKAWLAGQGAFELDFSDTDGGIGARGGDVQALIHETMQSARAAGALLQQAREWLRHEGRPAFAGAGVQLRRWSELSDDGRAAAARYFEDHVRPAFITASGGRAPEPIGPAGEGMPHLTSGTLALVVIDGPPDGTLYIVPIPESLSRGVALREGAEFLALEELLLLHAAALCPVAPTGTPFVLRVTRAADLGVGKRPTGDPVTAAEALLARRRLAPVVRIEVNCAMPRPLRRRLLGLFRAEAQAVGVSGATLDACDVFEADGPVVSLDGLDELARIPRADLCYEAFDARHPIPHDDALWRRLAAGDVFAHFPYDAFGASIERFVREAADDPDVVALRSTVYRTDRDSPIIASLVRAAEAGKDVLVVVELMARFDEAPNLRWTRRLREAGCMVVHAPPGLKVHSKVGAAVRREGGARRTYGFVSTGNLNSGTAKHYTDFAMLTARPAIVDEISALFDELAAGTITSRYEHLMVSPTTMRPRILSLIGREAARGSAGLIRAKLNGLDDQEIIGALYTAARAGVRVELVVRGLCTLRPGVTGFSDGITVSSIVGRFLEHGRIYAFGGGDGGPTDYWIGSADWRMRNLSHRVEVAAPVVDPDAQSRLAEVLACELSDPTRWIMQPDGSYVQPPNESRGSAESAQERFVAKLLG